jgi:hypothetical protein
MKHRTNNLRLRSLAAGPSLTVAGAVLALLGGGVACKGPADPPVGVGKTGGSGGSSMGGGGMSGMGGSGMGMGGTGNLPGVGGGMSMGMEGEVKTGLPPLPPLVNVKAVAIDDNVDISFDPVDDARDYRVYVLPNDADATSDSSGRLTIKNATYRCAGDRQAKRTLMEGEPEMSGLNIRTLVEREVDGVPRTLADATLGYVYVKPGPGRVPVYAMGDSAMDADNECEFIQAVARWQTSRSKRYITSEAERTMLLAKRWRDDGIVFYVPAAAAGNTRPVYANEANGTRYYYVDGPEATKRGTGTVAFPVLSAGTEPETKPLMRVFYKNLCGKSHDELAVGKPRFERARRQGDQIPVTGLHWAGLTGETTLVIEALAEGCPDQGFLAPKSMAAMDRYPKWETPEEIRARIPSGELYINGQHATTMNPKPIARSFVKISPGPKPDLDWFAGFNSPDSLGNLMNTPCGQQQGNCFAAHRQKSDLFDYNLTFVEGDRVGLKPMMGELWVAYADAAADTNGKFRLTPSQKPMFYADRFLYVTMTVDMFTTLRRYPQIIISDQDVPVQYQMQKGYALVLQTFLGWPHVYQLQVCNHQEWDVNSQCPTNDMRYAPDPADPAKNANLQPNSEPGEHAALDRSARFEIYASTKRAYIFLDGEPYGCMNLPAASVPAGPVTVTFGDVIYHSGVDLTFAYTSKDLQIQSRRHYDNLGFKAGVAAPAWDEQRIPCVSVLKKQI